MWVERLRAHYVVLVENCVGEAGVFRGGVSAAGSQGRLFEGCSSGVQGEEEKWVHQGSNLGPSDYESDALTD